MQTVTGRRGVLALLLMLAVGVLALVAATANTSAAGAEIESATAEHALPDAAAYSATQDHCGDVGDLALMRVADAGETALQRMPMGPGGGPGLGRCWVEGTCISIPPGIVYCTWYLVCD